MAEYKYQKLFHNSLINDQEYTRVYDAVYAYSIKYPSTDHSTPGRYRIRIVKYDGPADEFVPSPTLVGNLDKWSDKGWQHCLEWFGDPKTNFKKIEKYLNKMFRSFTTGQPTTANPETKIKEPPTPPPKPISKPIKFNVYTGGKKEDADPPKNPPEDDFDFV